MAVRQLGSCFFLFALMACVLLPAMQRTLRSQPEELEQLVRAYLMCLAAADLTVSCITRACLKLQNSKGSHSPLRSISAPRYGTSDSTAPAISPPGTS